VAGLPVPHGLVASISPLGTISDLDGDPDPGLMLHLVSDAGPDPIPIVSPVRGGWGALRLGPAGTWVTWSPCPDITLSVGPVDPIDAGPIPIVGADGTSVEIGDVVAHVPAGVTQLHFKVIDTRVSNGFLDVPAGVSDHRAVCLFHDCAGTDGGCVDYIGTEEANYERSLVRDSEGNPIPPAQACGVYPQEQAGTALGEWFPPDFDRSVFTGDFSPLILVRDSVHETEGILTTGTLSTTRNSLYFPNVPSVGAFRFNFATDGAGLNDDFAAVTTGPAHCYDSLARADGGPAGFIVLVQLQEDGGLLTEGVAGDSCAAVAGDGGYSFPLENETVLTR
jgi:hypothetical protein